MTRAPLYVPAAVVVVGAGAAGLAAARTLSDSGIDTIVLEARDRAGGRAYTLRTNDDGFPIELGAEFIHGKAHATMQLLRECGQSTLEIGDVLPGTWESAERVLSRVDVDGPDRSVDAFLKSIGDEGVDRARVLIEGFDAAITADASVVAIAKEWRGAANDTSLRPAEGYGLLMQHLAGTVKERIAFNTRVQRIAWSPQNVTVDAVRDGEALQVRARAAIVTLPIGVLQQDAVEFTPALPHEIARAIDAIAMGPVVKVMLHFRSIFWSDAFFQTPDACRLRTVWSRMPQRAPVLAAWAGGDAARRLLAGDADAVSAAIDTCQALFPRVDVRAQLRAAYYHNWQRDPYAAGAYSYLRVNGGDARERLAQPVGLTLFFAGEATCAQDSGTVAGALESGYRAAAQVGARLGR